jgi:hypothetical protein
MNYIKNLAFAPEKQRVAGIGAGDSGDAWRDTTNRDANS